MQKFLQFARKVNIEKLAEQLQASPRKSLTLLGILVSGVFIILGILALFFIRPSETEEAEPGGAEKTIEKEKVPPAQKRPSRAREAVSSFAVPLLVLLLILTGLVGTSQNYFCDSCHEMKKEYKSWQASLHKETSCVGCHQEPGLSGFIIEKVRMSKRAFLSLTHKYKRPITAEVKNGSCLRCHNEIKEKVSVKHTIRVSHKEFLNSRYKCVDCHSSLGHGKITPAAKNPSMDKCIACHNEKVASTRCNICHTKDIGEKPRTVLAGFPKARLDPPTNCRGCHPIDKCNKCHGLEMPHQADWKRKHPREGFVNKKVCKKCHDINFCRICHPNMPAPHSEGKNWVDTHDDYARNPYYGCGCHPDREYFCRLCHEMRR